MNGMTIEIKGLNELAYLGLADYLLWFDTHGAGFHMASEKVRGSMYNVEFNMENMSILPMSHGLKLIPRNSKEAGLYLDKDEFIEIVIS